MGGTETVINRCSGYPEYRLAMALLNGATGRFAPIHRTFWQRVVDGWRAGYAEFLAVERYIPPSAP